VHAFIDLAVQLGDIIQTTDPQAARQRDAKFKAGQPEMFQFPAPRLGPGVWLGDAAVVGRVFPQPMLRNGRRLDSGVGSHFAVIGDATLLASVSTDTRARWQIHGVVELADDSDELRTWMTEHGVRAVMLRPDRYVMGVANTAAELDSVTRLLPARATRQPIAA
jgi:3-(3-hydroxy-phenyl)propionate hydroxylase